MGEPTIHRWRWPARALALAGSVVALWLVFRRLDLASLAATLRTVRVGWYLAAQAVFGLGLLGSAIRWHLMLRLNHEAVVHAVASVRTVFISQFFNTFLGGPSPGDIPKTAMYSKWFGVPAAPVLAASVLDRLVASIGGLVFLALALAVGATAGAFDFVHQGEWRVPGSPWMWAGIFGGLIVALAILRSLSRRPGSFLARARAALRQSVRKLLTSRRRSAQALVCGVVTAILFNVTQLLCLEAVLQTPVPWLRLFWMYHIVTAVASLPLSFSGAGLREGTAMVLLNQYNIPATAAVAAALLTLSIQMTWAGIGAGLLWRESRRRRNLPTRPPSSSRPIAAIVHALDAADTLPQTVAHLRAVPEIEEIIVVDGGSRDGTAEAAAKLGCRVVACPGPPGARLHAGIEVARAEIVLLLSPDTWVGSDAGAAILRCLRDPLVVGGGFWKRFRSPPLVLRGARLRCGLRLWCLGRVSSDQALFVRREALRAAGGMPTQPLLEDVELCRRLRQVGRLALAGADVRASERPLVEKGIWRTCRLRWRIARAYRRGVPPEQLIRMHEQG